MFSSLSDRLGSVFSSLTARGRLSEVDVDNALVEIRNELLEADVALSVVKPFLASVREKAIGDEVLQSITPGQQIVKIVHDELVAVLGGGDAGDGDGDDIEGGIGDVFNFRGSPPHVILLAGLQGSGKTTTAAKLALYLRDRLKKKVLLASLDTARAAAQLQLQTLGEQIDCATLPIVEGQVAQQITERALSSAKLQGFDVLILDSAGRLQIDEALMLELQQIKSGVDISETFLVADAMMGQTAADMALEFHTQVGLSGIILTRVDGDGRGGAALSMRSVSGCPIRFFGTGEKVGDLELFNAKGLAGRILGRGDIVSLVEKAETSMGADSDAEDLARNIERGHFTMDDMAKQLEQVTKMGGLGGIMAMMPGMGAMKKQLAGSAGADESMIKRSRAIISSMTRQERQTPKIIHASRKRRIASGSGTHVQDVNKVLKQQLTMAKMAKKLSRMGSKEAMRSMQSLLGGQNF